MNLQFIKEPEAIVVYGAYPPDSNPEAQISHRDEVARAIADHPSNGYQYGVDISAGNVQCVMVKRVAGKAPIVLQPDPDTGEYPDGAEPATICVYASWR